MQRIEEMITEGCKHGKMSPNVKLFYMRLSSFLFQILSNSGSKNLKKFIEKTESYLQDRNNAVILFLLLRSFKSFNSKQLTPEVQEVLERNID